MRVDSCPAIRAATSRSPPFRRYSVIPVPRKLWAQISVGSPAVRARRLIIFSALKPRHRPILERIAPPGLAAPEQGSAAVFADAGGGEVGVDVGLRCVVGGDDVVAPALLVEAEERARALGVVVGDAKRDRGAHAREAVDEHAEEGAVAKA